MQRDLVGRWLPSSGNRVQRRRERERGGRTDGGRDGWLGGGVLNPFVVHSLYCQIWLVYFWLACLENEAVMHVACLDLADYFSRVFCCSFRCRVIVRAFSLGSVSS